MKNDFITRVKDPKFLAALSGVIYIIMKNMNIDMPLDEYQMVFSTIAYLLVGVGIYTKYDKK